eukprot:3365492-Pyramimonas_sp.AAC.1
MPIFGCNASCSYVSSKQLFQKRWESVREQAESEQNSNSDESDEEYWQENSSEIDRGEGDEEESADKLGELEKATTRTSRSGSLTNRPQCEEQAPISSKEVRMSPMQSSAVRSGALWCDWLPLRSRV